MSKQPAIIVDNVSMKFNLSKEKVDSLKDYIIKSIKKEIKYNEFWALQNVSFTVEKGDRVGILGLNGAGKSTLLKVIAGVFKPTEGSVTKHGKMVPLLELGAGFDPQYTGKENIYLYGAMLGYSKEFIDEKYDEIVKFSELKDFIDVPIKNYSSGMKSRLGFSIATVVSPKILILDEVLSVGDAKFRKKSEKKVLSMFDSGVTVLFVSHSLAQVQRICNKAMILEKGKLIAYGDIDTISEQYEKMTNRDICLTEKKFKKSEISGGVYDKRIKKRRFSSFKRSCSVTADLSPLLSSCRQNRKISGGSVRADNRTACCYCGML